MSSKPRLGIIDWGIGGVGIYRLIRARLGPVPALYFSDTGVTPYGKMSRHELVARLNSVLDFLRSQEITHLVVACNAASTVIPFLKASPLKVEGVVESAVRAAQRRRPTKLALIGGRRTVLSGIYRQALAERGIRVIQRIAQPLSGFIESGDVSSAALRSECRRTLSPVANCSHILLACTHYPAIIPVMKEAVSEDTVFVDPAEELVSRIRRWELPIGGADRVFTSGDREKMATAARIAFGVEFKKVGEIAI
jgi:glutamate racemase